MTVLQTVTNPQILQQIYDETWQIWSDGLSRADYERYNAAQMATAWGAKHLSRVALVEGGRLLASAKRYRLTVQVGAADVACLGIGAVFTPPDLRGRGHAAALVEAMIDEAREEGVPYALLFSEIDPAFYARLGFVPIPVLEASLRLRPTVRPGAPAVLMRGGDDRDAANIAAMHDARRRSDFTTARFGYSFALVRSEDYVRHAVTKRRLLAAFSPPGVRSVEFFVTEEGGNAVAYILISRGPEGVVLEEWGDRDPTGARVGAMLQVLAARTPAEPFPDLPVWVPRDFEPPQVERVDERVPRERAMIRGITQAAPSIEDAGAFYLKGDAF